MSAERGSWTRRPSADVCERREVGAREVAGDLPRTPVGGRRLRGQHDLECVVRVLRPRDRLAAALDAIDEVAQTLGPLPARIALGEQLPRAGAVAPQLVALGRPVVAEQLQHAVGAVQLDRGRAVLLHREARRDRGEARVAEVDQDVRVVLGLHAHRLALDDALGDRDARHRGHAPRRPEEAAQRGHVVDAEVEERAAAALVEPAAPVRARPAVARTREQQLPDVAVLDVRARRRGTSARAGCAARRSDARAIRPPAA